MTRTTDTHERTTGPDDTAPLAWRLMLTALVEELQPPEPAQPGPARRVAKRVDKPVPHVPDFVLRWRDAGPCAGGHHATWADR